MKSVSSSRHQTPMFVGLFLFPQLLFLTCANGAFPVTDTLKDFYVGASSLNSQTRIAQKFHAAESFEISEILIFMERAAKAGAPVVEIWSDTANGPERSLGALRATTSVGAAGAYAFRPGQSLSLEGGRDYWVVLGVEGASGEAELFRWYYTEFGFIGSGDGFVVDNWISDDAGQSWPERYVGWPYALQVVGEQMDGYRRVERVDLAVGQPAPAHAMEVASIILHADVIRPGESVKGIVAWLANSCPSCIVHSTVHGSWDPLYPLEFLHSGFNVNRMRDFHFTAPSEEGVHYLRFQWAFDIGGSAAFSAWNLATVSQWNAWGAASVFVVDFEIYVGDPPTESGGLFADASGDPRGWKYYPDFGWFHSPHTEAGWVYHLDHGWIWTHGETIHNFWFYSAAMGWMWTRSDFRPNVWSIEEGWLFHALNTGKPARYFSFSTETWILGGGNPYLLQPPVLKKVALDLGPLDIAGFPADSIETVGFFHGSKVENKRSEVQLAEDAGHQILALVSAEGKTLAVARVDAMEVAQGSAAIGLESIADALVTMNPVVLFVKAEDREAFVTAARNHPLYPVLIEEIAYGIQEEVGNLMDYDAFPGIFEAALEIGIDLFLENAGLSDDHPLLMAAREGEGHRPRLRDLPGPHVGFVNPTYIFYGVSVEPAGLNFVLPRRSGFTSLQWAWPPITWTEPAEVSRELGDGVFDVVFYKGLNYDGPGAFNPRRAPGMAKYANLLKTLCLVIDLFAVCPLGDTAIAGMVNYFAEPHADLIGEIVSIFRDSVGWIDVVEKTIGFINRHWDEVSLWIWQHKPGTGTADFMRQIQPVSVSLEKGVKALGKVLKYKEVVNSTVPFFSDMLFTAPEIVEYCFTQTGGALALTCESAPPVARFSVSEGPYFVGSTITLNASATTHGTDPLHSLQFRWDFAGDGFFDTPWTHNTTENFTYTNQGPYSIVLEVRDSSGNVSRAAYSIFVETEEAGGTAQHIVLVQDGLPWDSNAFRSMMGRLGIPEGTGPDTFEVVPSTEFATRLFRPRQDLLIIANDQNQDYYDRLAANQGRLHRFIENGGVVLWMACDRGWAGGSMAQAGVRLPAGIGYVERTDRENLVTNWSSVLTSGLPETLTGYFASHEYFTGLPPNTVVFTTDSGGGPTLLEYRLSDGFVVLTGQPLEWGYDRLGQYSIGRLYPRLIEYILGYGYD